MWRFADDLGMLLRLFPTLLTTCNTCARDKFPFFLVEHIVVHQNETHHHEQFMFDLLLHETRASLVCEQVEDRFESDAQL